MAHRQRSHEEGVPRRPHDGLGQRRVPRRGRWRNRHDRRLGHDVGIRASDLLRLLRVHRYRAGFRCAVRIPDPDQLQHAVSRDITGGLLAAVAYQPVELAARLRVHPAWRVAAPDADRHAEHIHHLRALRAVARRGVDVCGVRRHVGGRPCAAHAAQTLDRYTVAPSRECRGLALHDGLLPSQPRDLPRAIARSRRCDAPSDGRSGHRLWDADRPGRALCRGHRGRPHRDLAGEPSRTVAGAARARPDAAPDRIRCGGVDRDPRRLRCGAHLN